MTHQHVRPTSVTVLVWLAFIMEAVALALAFSPIATSIGMTSFDTLVNMILAAVIFFFGYHTLKGNKTYKNYFLYAITIKYLWLIASVLLLLSAIGFSEGGSKGYSAIVRNFATIGLYWYFFTRPTAKKFFGEA